MVALFLALVLSSTAAQSGSGEAQTTGTSRVALATVTDPHNRPLVDVGADDFVIQEAGAAREILSARPADYPIVVLLDTANEARADLPLIQRAAARFLERIGRRPIALGTFGGTPKIVATFEDDRQQVMAKLASLSPETSAGSWLLQGAALAGRTIHATGTQFAAIVLLSATPDDDSQAQADEMMATIVDSNAILHVVADRPSSLAGSGDRSSVTLRALADRSRGDFTMIYSAASFQAALDHLADRLTSEMMIEYLVPAGSKPNDVKVGVRIVGARIRGLGVAPR